MNIFTIFTPLEEEYTTSMYILRTGRPTTDRPRILENLFRMAVSLQQLCNCNGSSDPLRIWFQVKSRPIGEHNARGVIRLNTV